VYYPHDCDATLTLFLLLVCAVQASRASAQREWDEERASLKRAIAAAEASLRDARLQHDRAVTTLTAEHTQTVASVRDAMTASMNTAAAAHAAESSRLQAELDALRRELGAHAARLEAMQLAASDRERQWADERALLVARLDEMQKQVRVVL
jgi:hypothetical protein